MSRRSERELDEYEREKHFYERLEPHEKINFSAARYTNRLLAELRFIRWLLIAILLLVLDAMWVFGPADWWHHPWFH